MTLYRFVDILQRSVKTCCFCFWVSCCHIRCNIRPAINNQVHIPKYKSLPIHTYYDFHIKKSPYTYLPTWTKNNEHICCLSKNSLTDTKVLLKISLSTTPSYQSPPPLTWQMAMQWFYFMNIESNIICIEEGVSGRFWLNNCYFRSPLKNVILYYNVKYYISIKYIEMSETPYLVKMLYTLHLWALTLSKVLT